MFMALRATKFWLMVIQQSEEVVALARLRSNWDKQPVNRQKRQQVAHEQVTYSWKQYS